MGVTSADFSLWLKNYLSDLSQEIDTDVYGKYIEGLLQDETVDKEEILESITCFLESILPPESATVSSERIFNRFNDHDSTIVGKCACTTTESDETVQLDDLENQMRLLLINQQQQQQQKQTTTKSTTVEGERGDRDACTVAVLKGAGVFGYQDTKEEETALSVALADAEFFSKQKLASAHLNTVPGSGGPFRSFKLDSTDTNMSAPESETIDLEELEDAQGYCKKDGIKPGNVMDALSTLNPEKFKAIGQGQSDNTGSALDKTRLKRLPTPGDVNSSTTPAYLLLAPRSHQLVAAATATAAPNAASSTASVSASKKKAPPPSKHLADIGARAEEKQQKLMARKREKLAGIVASSRIDDMDAFFMSDDDEDDAHKKVSHRDVLLEGGGNRERTQEADRVAREVAAKAHSEGRARAKTERARQLDAEAKRKAAAHQRAQKVERRRH